MTVPATSVQFMDYHFACYFKYVRDVIIGDFESGLHVIIEASSEG